MYWNGVWDRYGDYSSSSNSQWDPLEDETSSLQVVGVEAGGSAARGSRVFQAVTTTTPLAATTALVFGFLGLFRTP